MRSKSVGTTPATSPEAMQAIYDYTHRRAVAAAEKVAELQKMYR